MSITEEDLEAFLNCETKSYLTFNGVVGVLSEFGQSRKHLREMYRQTWLCDPLPLEKAEYSAVSADSLKREYPQRFGEVQFVLPEFYQINEAAYWEYQRNKIYVRSNNPIAATQPQDGHRTLCSRGSRQQIDGCRRATSRFLPILQFRNNLQVRKVGANGLRPEIVSHWHKAMGNAVLVFAMHLLALQIDPSAVKQLFNLSLARLNDKSEIALALTSHKSD
jgi:hypothetical protein